MCYDHSEFVTSQTIFSRGRGHMGLNHMRVCSFSVPDHKSNTLSLFSNML